MGLLLLAAALAVGTTPAAAKTVFQDDAALISCGGFPGSAARRFRLDQNGRPDLRVQVSGGVSGNYAVVVNGRVEGTLVVDGLGNGQVEFDTSPAPGQLLLDFPLAVDTPIDLDFQNGQTAYSLTNSADCKASTGPGGSTTSTSSTVTTTTDTSVSSTSTTSISSSSTSDTSASSTSTTSISSSSTSTTLPGQTCQAVENLVSLRNCGAISGAAGDRRMRVHVDCDQDLRIRGRNLGKGTFDVYVGGTLRGSFKAVRGQGELEWDTSPAVNQLLLTFDPLGDVQVKKGSRTVLAYPTCP